MQEAMDHGPDALPAAEAPHTRKRFKAKRGPGHVAAENKAPAVPPSGGGSKAPKTEKDTVGQPLELICYNQIAQFLYQNLAKIVEKDCYLAQGVAHFIFVPFPSLHLDLKDQGKGAPPCLGSRRQAQRAPFGSPGARLPLALAGRHREPLPRRGE